MVKTINCLKVISSLVFYNPTHTGLWGLFAPEIYSPSTESHRS